MIFLSPYVNATANDNWTTYGYNSGNAAGGTSVTAFGSYALYSNESGGENVVAVGDDALKANTTGSNNTAVGTSALGANTTASNNAAVGYQSLDLIPRVPAIPLSEPRL